MIASSDRFIRSAGRLLALIALAALPTRAGAQTAESFRAPAAAAASSTPAPASAPAGSPITSQASRYAGSDIADYVQRTIAHLSMTRRATDPFGRHQNPDYKPPVQEIARPGPAKYAPQPVTPFSDIVAAIPVTTVMPAKGAFLVGNRTFKIGDHFPLRLPNGKSIRVQVAAVTGAAIEFRNLESGETGVLKLTRMPAGMQRGKGGDEIPPGVQIEDASAPLDVLPDGTPASAGN